jgi:hypothetical protein
MAILALLTALVGGSRGSLVAPNADARLDIALVVPTKVRFLLEIEHGHRLGLPLNQFASDRIASCQKH